MNHSINCMVNVPEEIYRSKQNRGFCVCMLRLIFKYPNRKKKKTFSFICRVVVSFYHSTFSPCAMDIKLLLLCPQVRALVGPGTWIALLNTVLG